MEARLEEGELTSVDRKPEATEQREVPNEDTIVKPMKRRKRRYRGQEASCRATQRAEETDLRRLWIPDEVGWCLQEGIPPCNSGTT
jgi:hypothetical protein